MIKQIILVLALFLLMGFIIGKGLDKQEINECNKWKGQMETIQGFYLAEWQQEQCNFHGIIIK